MGKLDKEIEDAFARYVKTLNPCLGCTCWDPDYEGCTMPDADRSYACDLESDPDKSFYIMDNYHEERLPYSFKSEREARIALGFLIRAARYKGINFDFDVLEEKEAR